MLVEREHQLGRESPDGGRYEIHPVDRSQHGPYDRPEMNQYDRLSSLDASFLHLERPEYPMHVGAVSVLEGAPFFDADGRFRIDEVRDLVLSRLPLMPRFRRRLMPVPYEQGRPIWVDDDRFDITYHVRHTALPRPGSWEQLVALTTRVQEGLLDRERPLWEIWLVEGRRGRQRRAPAEDAPRARSTASRASTSRRCCSTCSPTSRRRSFPSGRRSPRRARRSCCSTRCASA